MKFSPISASRLCTLAKQCFEKTRKKETNHITAIRSHTFYDLTNWNYLINMRVKKSFCLAISSELMLYKHTFTWKKHLKIDPRKGYITCHTNSISVIVKIQFFLTKWTAKLSFHPCWKHVFVGSSIIETDSKKFRIAKNTTVSVLFFAWKQ